MHVEILQNIILLKKCGPQTLLFLFMFRPITLKLDTDKDSFNFHTKYVSWLGDPSSNRFADGGGFNHGDKPLFSLLTFYI